MKSSQKTVSLTTKAIALNGYFGTQTEDAAWGTNYMQTANVSIQYNTTSDDPNVPPVLTRREVTLAQLEADFPGIVTTLTAIADKYNPANAQP